MPGASDVQTSFLGGEWSPMAQGQMEDPAYKTALNVCLNMVPLEQHSAVRAPGTQFAATTRGGTPGRVISFSFEAALPYTMEFTDGFLRFFNGTSLVTTNDNQVVTGISTANPAVVTTTSNHGWSTGNSVNFPTGNALLQNRVFTITKTGNTTFSIADAVTGANIDGSTLGTFTTATVARVLEFATNYGAGTWASVRSIQAETQAVLVNGSQPQILSVVTPPTPLTNATFTFVPSNFTDGPYFDPYKGSVVTYDVLVGNVTLTFSFAVYSATISYSLGDYVLSGGIGYKSLINANLNNTPASNPTDWVAVQGGDPVGPSGFTAVDVGRHIRLFSEPPPWLVGSPYVSPNVVKFNNAYYQAVANSTGVTPGTDVTKWAPVSGAAFAVWTWGRILSVSGAGLITPSVAIGNYTVNASAIFDGAVSKGAAASAAISSAAVTTYPAFIDHTAYAPSIGVYYNGNLYTSINNLRGDWAGGSTYATNDVVIYASNYYKWRLANGPGGLATPNTVPTAWQLLGTSSPTNTTEWTSLGAAPSATIDVYAGQDFHSTPKKIVYGTVFPSTDLGYGTNLPVGAITINLRAKHTLPANASDGTILGTLVTNNTLAPNNIYSNDTATAWEYFWFETSITYNAPLPDNGSHSFQMTNYLAQAQFFTPNVGNGSVVVIQLAGPPLLYVAGTVVTTWRAGLYNSILGWPTCGTYAQGRLWLSGVVDNRVDASASNALFNFSPTNSDGTVVASNGIAATLNADDSNPILWLQSELQGIVCGTGGGEFLLSAPGSGIFAPNNIAAARVTKVKCANIEPRRTEHTLAFVQKFQKKVVEYFPEVFSGKFTAPSLSKNAKHLTVSGIAELAYQQETAPIIWARCNDGTLIGAVYKRDTLMTSSGPTFIGWFRRLLGSGRIVKSICVGPNLDGLMTTTVDPKTGIYHVEALTNLPDEGTTLLSAWHLDDAVVPTSYVVGATSLTINGLWHLNGKAVDVWAAGLDCGTFTVASGLITVPFGDGVAAGTGGGLFTAALVNSFLPTCPIVIGFTFTSDLQRVRPFTPADTGARNGPGFAKLKRGHQFGVLLFNTLGISFGTSFARLRPAIFKQPNGQTLPITQAFSGIYWNTLDDDYGYDSMQCARITRPYPATICVFGGFRETQDT